VNFHIQDEEIDADTHVPLPAGQAVVVHPNQYLPETGYLACGETVLVTADGCEPLGSRPRVLVQA